MIGNSSKPLCTYLGPDIFQKVWVSFAKDKPAEKWYNHIHYESSSLRVRHEFQIWLWDQSASIRRRDNKYYLEFFNEADAMFFLLKWA